MLEKTKSIKPVRDHGIDRTKQLEFITDGSDPRSEEVARSIREFQENQARYLEIAFVTVQEYLDGLDHLVTLTSGLGSRAVFYLAAAVSDFYIPEDKMAEHKIQSRDIDTLKIELEPVPKMLGIIKERNPKAIAISFKLETDQAILKQKATSSMNKYNMDMVVANLLQTARTKCTIYSKQKNRVKAVKLSASSGKSLEELIISQIYKSIL